MEKMRKMSFACKFFWIKFTVYFKIPFDTYDPLELLGSYADINEE